MINAKRVAALIMAIHIAMLAAAGYRAFQPDIPAHIGPMVVVMVIVLSGCLWLLWPSHD